MEAYRVRFLPSPWRSAVLAALLAAAGLWGMTAAARPAQASPVLARAEEWEIRRGAAVYEGREVSVPGREIRDGELMLTDGEHPLPASFPAPSTRGVSAMVGAYLNADPAAALRQEVIYALCAMEFEHPWHLGAKITEGALSAAQLEERQRDALKRYAAILPLDQALAQARQSAPNADESEHRTGFAFDLELLGPLAMSREDPLLRNETGAWMKDNLWRYGFIRRFGPGCEKAGCEQIHIRYVGKAHAAAMRLLNAELEDYLSLLRREGALTVYREGAPWAVILCVPEEETLSFLVPPEGGYTVSADNAGWVAAAVTFPERR